MTQAISDPRQASAALADLFDTHKRVVFFGGAGVSTASGIPDFRSVDGLYHQQFAYPPETMLSHSFYETHPAEFFDFYRTKMIALNAKPNRCHTKLAELERAGKLDAVVTQNIDGLHQMAGSQRVFELHGSVHRNICQSCGAVYSAEWICSREHEDAAGVPRVRWSHQARCGAFLRHRGRVCVLARVRGYNRKTECKATPPPAPQARRRGHFRRMFMANDSKTWRCGKYELSFDRPRIMGVLNVTPDSFSDGGEHFDPDAAIEYGLAMLDAGADIIDVGGESTRPGFTPVNPDEEARRVLPVVRALAKEGAIVSIDTRHVAVAKAAVRCGASIVNDVTGFTDLKMVEFVKTSTCGVIVMHAGEVAAPTRTHATVQLDTSAAAFVAEKAREAAAEAAREAEKPARRRRGKLLGEPKPEAKLPGGVVQPSLPFGEPEATSEPSSEQETPAAEQAAAAETVAPAPEATPAATEAASESNDRLAAMMRRSARREEAYVPTSQLRRFTLPDSAPIMRRVMGFLSDQARTLIHAGVSRDRICIDPGPGFGKSANEDIVIQRETAKMASLGYPLMCAVSRKRFVGAVSGVTEAAERDAATFGVCLGAIQAGANIVRVHDAAGFAQFLNGYWAVAKPQPRRAFVAVGSNLGHRCDNIRAARDMIAEIPLTCVSNSSKIYESEPAYETRQDAFANAVIEIKTELAPLVLLDELMKIEAELGRDRSKKAKVNGPRTIDLDLLWMDGETHGGKKLRLPHPLIGERDFVLVPLEDLMHDPARFFRYNGVEVKEPEDRVGHIVGELGRM